MRVATLKVAVPLFSTPVPRVMLPSLNVTVPVALAGETVAVSVVFCPSAEGFGEDVSVVVVTA